VLLALGATLFLVSGRSPAAGRQESLARSASTVTSTRAAR